MSPEQTPAEFGYQTQNCRLISRGCQKSLPETDDRITVVGEASSAIQAVAVSTDTGADIVLLDLRLPDLSDLDATVRIVSHPAFAEVALRLIASAQHDEQVHSAIRAGAIGVLPRDVEPYELVRAVNALARGEHSSPQRRAWIAAHCPRNRFATARRLRHWTS